MSSAWTIRLKPKGTIPLPTGSAPPGGAHKPSLSHLSPSYWMPTPKGPRSDTTLLLEGLQKIIEVLKEERDADRERAEMLLNKLSAEQDLNAQLRAEVKELKRRLVEWEMSE